MKNFRKIFLGFLLIASPGCSSDGTVQDDSSLPIPSAQDTHTANETPKQPFIFEEVGLPLPNGPIHIEHLPTGRWLIATVEGKVFLLEENFERLPAGEIEDIELINDSGLMSMIPDPDYLANRYVYAYFTWLNSDPPCNAVYCNKIVRFTLDEGNAFPLQDPTDVAILPSVNRVGFHNGGAMAFGPDGALYAGVGNGALELSEDRSQDVGLELGKILRIDVSDPTFPREIVASGLRNPFTGFPHPAGFVVGEVGGDRFEELNLMPWGQVGLNFGWPLEEGFLENAAFDRPFYAFTHCDISFQEEDPFGHDTAHASEPETMEVKLHNGVVHECGDTVITAIAFYPGVAGDPYEGALDNTVLYSSAYYGSIRGITLDPNGEARNDRHLAHKEGITSAAIGPDGYIYAVSVFGADGRSRVMRLIRNPELQ